MWKNWNLQIPNSGGSKNRVQSVQASATSFGSKNEIYTLDGIRSSLIRQEDSIIFSLVERAQFRYNEDTYEPNAFFMDGFKGSLVEFMVGRYKSPDEHPFFPKDLPDPMLPPLEYPQILILTSKIWDLYFKDILPRLVKEGNDDNCGSATTCDSTCLQVAIKKMKRKYYVWEECMNLHEDMWAVRAILAELFTLCLMFPGESEIDQFYKICCVFGTPDWTLFPEARNVARLMDISYSMIMHANLADLIPNASSEAINFIKGLREISNFAMAKNEGEYMLVPHKHKINFYRTTKVRVSTDFVDTVDPYHFISFPDLLARNFDTRVAFDFLGEVVSTDPMRVIVEYGREKRLMNLIAQDLSGTKIAVALWDSFTLKLNTYISQHHNETAAVIILLRLAKLKIWGGKPQVGNCLFGSRLHINGDMPHILEFKSNLNVLDTNVESSSRTSQLNSDTVVANPEDYYLRFQIKNIDEIPDFNEEVGLTIIATIIGFDVDDGWYSFYCRDCSKKVTKNYDDVDAGPFHCDGCGFVSDVHEKIRIVVRVQDESVSSSFVLFERHAKDLIHRGNQWLMEKIAKDQGRQQIPDEFKILLNKKFVFKVQISMFNLQNNYHAYTVHKLTDDERVLAEIFKRSPNHEHQNINDNGTPINKPNKENTNYVHDGNLDVVDLEAATPSSSTGKRPIEIDANTDSLEWSSSKIGAVRSTLKIPKLEKFD
ncbi:unnamed protein product [Lactuca virosa]|uniref:chorismate mutase n=1 Tax=Lactuca virosa TaxID=75947 RepID=A0AAU9NRH3_9ASTR|nr:unnamed protein product [Lactuca virosa]